MWHASNQGEGGLLCVPSDIKVLNTIGFQATDEKQMPKYCTLATGILLERPYRDRSPLHYTKTTNDSSCLAPSQIPEKEPPIRKFPRGFMWGTATSAYQVEGAYQDEGKGLSIWDAFTHSPGKITGGQNADVSACNFYRYRGVGGGLRDSGKDKGLSRQ